MRTARDLDDARSASPSIIVTAEGGDFLEGRPERVDDAYERWALRHLQLTHYRVNDLGDIQTEPPVHGGLTPTGADVIRRCNRLGIVVDVAHGTYDLVRQAATVTDKPLVLSHTSLTAAPVPHSRLISPDHARAIAGTGGLVGPSTFDSYRNLPALADALLQHGLGADDVRRILGGNYAHVFRASLGDRAVAPPPTSSGGAA